MPTLIRCWNCKTDGSGTFFDKQHHECPKCGAPRRGFNKYLRTAQLNNHLFAQAENAKKG